MNRPNQTKADLERTEASNCWINCKGCSWHSLVARSARFDGGLRGSTPSGASQPPSLYWPPLKNCRNKSKIHCYDLWFSHKSSTGGTSSAECVHYQYVPNYLPTYSPLYLSTYSYILLITNTLNHQHIIPIHTKLHCLPIKQWIDYKLRLLTYKTNQQPTYLYNSLSFSSHSVSTRSSDSFVLSIPYVRSSLGKRAFSVIGHRLWSSLPPDTWNSIFFFANIPFQAQNTPLQNCVLSLGPFPSPLTVYPDFDSCYSHFMPYQMTPTGLYIEVHY